MAADETLMILNLWQFVFNSVSGLIIINVCPDTGRYSVTALQFKKYAVPVLGGVALILWESTRFLGIQPRARHCYDEAAVSIVFHHAVFCLHLCGQQIDNRAEY